MAVNKSPSLVVRLARDADDLIAAQRLRYQVFVEEMGAVCAGADHENRLERDDLDPHFDHLLLVDPRKNATDRDHVVGVYRLLPQDRAATVGRFYSDAEFDLTPLTSSGKKLVELGRSCVHPDYRRGASMLLLWNGLAEYVIARGIEVMFGVASFPGANPDHHAAALAWLTTHHLAPEPLRVTVRAENAQTFTPPDDMAIDAKTVSAQIPSLIRAYLRLGGFVGQGAYVDHDFNTTDVCLIMDTSTMSERAVDFYTRKTPRA